MKINNFMKHINSTILQRGYDYYHEGNVVDAYDQRENEYIFQVQGSEDYEVVVKIDENGEILSSDCDCPYDFGPICKHQAAAYFKLSEILNIKENNTKSKQRVAKQPGIREVLNSISKEELIDIIIDITKKDSTLKNSLILRYSKGDTKQELEKCKRLIDSIVRKYGGREGFITYREAYDFVCEMEEILEKIRVTKDKLLALDIAFLLLNEAIEALQYTDDSDGYIGSLVTETLEQIGETIADNTDLDIDLREKIFNKLLEQSDSKVFDGWEDYKIDLLRLCAEFADVEELRNRLKNKIQYLVNNNLGNEYKQYSNENMLLILFGLIETYGTKAEAEEFIKDNLVFTSFRELLIGKYIGQKNFCLMETLSFTGN